MTLVGTRNASQIGMYRCSRIAVTVGLVAALATAQQNSSQKYNPFFSDSGFAASPAKVAWDLREMRHNRDSSQARAANPTDSPRIRVIVQYHGNLTGDDTSKAQALGAELEYAGFETGIAVYQMSEDAAERLALDPAVDYISPDRPVESSGALD